MSKHKHKRIAQRGLDYDPTGGKQVEVREIDLKAAPPVKDNSGGRYMVSLPIGIGKMNNGPPSIFQPETIHFSLLADNVEDARLQFTEALQALLTK